VIVADPRLTPVMLGDVVGEVAPAGIVTVVTDILAIDVLLLLSAMVTPPVGAAGEMEIGKAAV
jgi:hypothetical protein